MLRQIKDEDGPLEDPHFFILLLNSRVDVSFFILCSGQKQQCLEEETNLHLKLKV